MLGGKAHGGSSVHCVWPSDGPGLHGVASVDPVAQNEPTGHAAHSLGILSPRDTEKLPPGHGSAALAPDGQKLPPSHGPHAVAPSSRW